MKRVSLILFAYVIGIVANAQITNKIWNLTLGISGKQQVTNVINAHHLEIRDKGTDYITCSSNNAFEFGGESWNYAKFRFYNGKLYSISFSYTTFFSVKESFDRLKNSLDKKYSSYIKDKDLTTYGDWYIDYDDGKTTISLTYNIEQGRDFVGIMYYDDALILKHANKSNSEL
ncbi:MAG: hypothetical protein K2H35_08085 [Muribaculaceae bacterium]|nr:hypothetical protein [Muribaculaceae bacterium]